MTSVFLLLLGSVAVATYAWFMMPAQRSAVHTGNYTAQAREPFGTTELAYWMGLIGKRAAVPERADFVNNIMLPHFYLFAPIVYGLEVLTAASLILRLFVRWAAQSVRCRSSICGSAFTVRPANGHGPISSCCC